MARKKAEKGDTTEEQKDAPASSIVSRSITAEMRES
jgi:hypothetical protein